MSYYTVQNPANVSIRTTNRTLTAMQDYAGPIDGMNAAGLPNGIEYGDYLFWNQLNPDLGLWQVGRQNINIGAFAGSEDQGVQAVAVGNGAGAEQQSEASVAVGPFAGSFQQGELAVSVGPGAGAENQAEGGIAIGFLAGEANQGLASVAIGAGAGNDTQGPEAVAVGYAAANLNQGIGAVSVGTNAGGIDQGDYSIAIGLSAGAVNQPENSIVLNSSGVPLNPTTSGFFVSSLRNEAPQFPVYYNPTTKEITYYFVDSPLTSVSLSSLHTQLAELSLIVKNQQEEINQLKSQLSASR